MNPVSCVDSLHDKVRVIFRCLIFVSQVCTWEDTGFVTRASWRSATLPACVFDSTALSIRLFMFLILQAVKWPLTIMTFWDSLHVDSSFLMPKISAKFQQSHPERGCQIEVGFVQIGDFRQNLAISQKRCKIGT